MSKPITGVAILMLMEEGRVRLNDPVSRFIPEFKGSKVAVGREGEASTVAAERGRTPRSFPPTIPSRVVTLDERRDGKLTRGETPSWLATRTLFSGGGGLWSTPEDYMRFAQMLVNGGEHSGKRILSPRTVDLMASNHVGDLENAVMQAIIE